MNPTEFVSLVFIFTTVVSAALGFMVYRRYLNLYAHYVVAMRPEPPITTLASEPVIGPVITPPDIDIEVLGLNDRVLGTCKGKLSLKTNPRGLLLNVTADFHSTVDATVAAYVMWFGEDALKETLPESQRMTTREIIHLETNVPVLIGQRRRRELRVVNESPHPT